MRRSHAFAFVVAVLSTAAPARNDAHAQCPALPYQLTNGQVADATQVMANFDALTNCINSRGIVSGGTVGQIGTYATTGTTISG